MILVSRKRRNDWTATHVQIISNVHIMELNPPISTGNIMRHTRITGQTDCPSKASRAEPAAGRRTGESASSDRSKRLETISRAHETRDADDLAQKKKLLF